MNSVVHASILALEGAKPDERNANAVIQLGIGLTDDLKAVIALSVLFASSEICTAKVIVICCSVRCLHMHPLALIRTLGKDLMK